MSYRVNARLPDDEIGELLDKFITDKYGKNGYNKGKALQELLKIGLMVSGVHELQHDEEVNACLESYLNYTSADDTTTVVGDEGMSEDQILEAFDSSSYKQFYLYEYDVIETEYLETVFEEITGKNSKKNTYNWKVCSRVIKENKRLDHVNGTNRWMVNRHRFDKLDPLLKEALDKRIKLRSLDDFWGEMPEEYKDPISERLHIKLEYKKKYKFEDLQKLGNKLSYDATKRCIQYLTNKGMLQMDQRRYYFKADPERPMINGEEVTPEELSNHAVKTLNAKHRVDPKSKIEWKKEKA